LVDPPESEIRVGDRERRETDDRLRLAYDDGVLTLIEYDERDALCWAARTRGDLDELVRDLPPPHPPDPVTEELPEPETPDPWVHRWRVAAIAGAALFGIGLLLGVPALGAADGMSFFGSRAVTTLDRNAVDVGVLFGSVQVVVPDDVRVRTNGAVPFGSFNCTEACSSGKALQREVVVNGSGAFGSVDVVRQSQLNRRIADRDHHHHYYDDKDDD
jgi:F0F1-type ATP synthase membrane subunit c/vacuolar-type H+-ATPase subunit K